MNIARSMRVIVTKAFVKQLSRSVIFLPIVYMRLIYYMSINVLVFREVRECGKQRMFIQK